MNHTSTSKIAHKKRGPDSLPLAFYVGVRGLMMKRLMFILIIISSPALGWECPDTNNSYDLDIHWEAAKQIFIGTVLEARYEPEDESYTYRVRIDKGVRGNYQEEILILGEYNPPQLPVGVGFLFLLLENERMDFCTLTLHFQAHWLDWELERVPNNGAMNIWQLINENL